MDAYIKDRLKTMHKEIEDLTDQLSELKIELVGAEITYNGRDAIIIHVDWTEKSVLLNVDHEGHEKEEWVSF